MLKPTKKIDISVILSVKHEIKVERSKRVKPEGTSNRHKGKFVTYLDSQIKTENIRFDKVFSKKDTDDTIKTNC